MKKKVVTPGKEKTKELAALTRGNNKEELDVVIKHQPNEVSRINEI